MQRFLSGSPDSDSSSRRTELTDSELKKAHEAAPVMDLEKLTELAEMDINQSDQENR